MTTVSNLKLTARDVMTSEPVCVEPHVGLPRLARMFEEYEISGMPVVDGAGKVIGVVSKTDLIHRCLEQSEHYEPGYLYDLLMGADEEGDPIDGPGAQICVETFMTPDPITARPDESLMDVARRMAEAHVHRIVVVDDAGVAIGIVTSLDLLRAISGLRSRR